MDGFWCKRQRDGLFHWRKHYYWLWTHVLDRSLTWKCLVSVSEWCGVDYLRIIVLFLSADTYSDGTHSLQSIHWWASDGMLHFYKPDEETNSSTSWMVWRLSTFSEKTHFGVKYSFNIRAIWPGIMRVGSYLDFDCDRSVFKTNTPAQLLEYFTFYPLYWAYLVKNLQIISSWMRGENQWSKKEIIKNTETFNTTVFHSYY